MTYYGALSYLTRFLECKFMNFGRRVSNMYKDWFIFEKSWYDSPRTNQGHLRRTFAYRSKLSQGSINHPRLVIREPCSIEGASIYYVDGKLEYFSKVMFWQVFERIYGCATRRWVVDVNGHTIGRSWFSLRGDSFATCL